MANVILGVGGFLLAMSLIPSFRRGSRPSMLTSSTYLLIMSCFVWAYWYEHLYLAVASTSLSWILWLILLILKGKE